MSVLELGGISIFSVIPVLTDILLPNRAIFLVRDIAKAKIVTYKKGIRMNAILFSRVSFEVEWPNL